MIFLLASLAWAEPVPAEVVPAAAPEPTEAAQAPAPAVPLQPPEEPSPDVDVTGEEDEAPPPEGAVSPEEDPAPAPEEVPDDGAQEAEEPIAADPDHEAQEPAPAPARAAKPFLRFGPPWDPTQQPAQDDPEPSHEAPTDHEDAPADAGTDPPREPSAQPNGWVLPIPQQSTGGTVLFLVVMAISSVASSVARSTRKRLRPGAIAALLRIADTAGRILLVVGGIGLVTQLLPRPLLPALPWAALAGALAIGWSLRDALPDLIAWTQLSAEGSVRRGQWVRGEDFNGRVERIGLRATWLADDRGQRVSVPNRLLVQGTMRTDKDRWYVAEVHLDLPNVDPARARRALEDACMLSPWVAPSAQVDVRWDPVSPTRWSLRVQLLEGGFADPFRGALRERVEELLRLP